MRRFESIRYIKNSPAVTEVRVLVGVYKFSGNAPNTIKLPFPKRKNTVRQNCRVVSTTLKWTWRELVTESHQSISGIEWALVMVINVSGINRASQQGR